MGGGGDNSGLWGQTCTSNESLNNHFAKHGKNTATDSPQQYQKKASDFVNNKNPMVQTFTKNGSTYMYNPVTNEFALVSESGKIVTYYYPTSPNYWSNEPWE